ncbi:MAG: phosphotransferase [Ktedonobacteraceae bacterium]|nr:phosphotransferase [Ktedonobacteraceae bacterium]
MNHSADSLDTDTSLSIVELPLVLTALFARVRRPLLSASHEPLGLFVRYLRRKPARGLAVIYTVDELRSKPSRKKVANAPNRSVSLTLDEQALKGARIRFSTQQAQQAPLEVQSSGVIRVADLGLSVQAFPADNGLPALATSCDTSRHSLLFATLESAAQEELRSSAWQLIAAQAQPVRYKPANRCVIRYRLVLQSSTMASQRDLTIFGKVYADPHQAHAVQMLQRQLYDEQARAGQVPFLPRPLAIIDELGLTLNEAVQPIGADELDTDGSGDFEAQLRTGTQALQARIVRGRGGQITQVMLPSEELHLSALALTRLHTSVVRPEGAPRTGAKEAKRTRERAALLAAHNPQQAEGVWHLAHELAARLETLQPAAYWPVHGGFKASQLLFHGHNVFVVDFDGFCLADPALDVGYFLAYLRPSGLWYQRAGMRQWFADAAEIFMNVYRQGLLERGEAQAVVDAILQRSRLYEAALLFKIATRRVNRLNSPRPKELAAILREIATCLAEK